MVQRCMEAFYVPLSQHGWCQLWCCDVRNHLASRKIEWRTPTEILLGDTPDISVFRFHFWEQIEYYNPAAKQPSSGWLSGRLLGINRQTGDAMPYFIKTEKEVGRYVVLTRSTIRSRTEQNSVCEQNDQIQGSLRK